jgi:hypothetical protein
MPESAQAASTAAWVAEPSYGEIHVAASASRRDILRPASRGGPTTTTSSSTSGSASISGAAAKPPTTPSSARCERSASMVCADAPGTILIRTPGCARWKVTTTSGRR